MTFFLPALALVGLVPFAAASKVGDRPYAVEIVTTVGKCEKTIAARFVVRGDDIISDRASALIAEGAVEKNGTMWARMAKDRDLYRLQGKLKGATGSGAWSSNTRLCGGTWRGRLAQ
ncbi:MAG: hypothetical protein AB7F96_02530 [Beijerinckiaceae bacterium]